MRNSEVCSQTGKEQFASQGNCLNRLNVNCRLDKQAVVLPFHYVVQKNTHAELVLLELMEL